MADTLVDGIVYAFVRLGAPIGKQFFVSLDQIEAAVCTASIDNKPLVVGKGLSSDRSHRTGQPIAIVIVDGDDGKTHHSSQFLILLS